LGRQSFDWHNQDHHHSGIDLMTPDQVHLGRVDAVHAAPEAALDRAFAQYPARFVNKAPVPLAKPTATWINRPAPKAVTECRSLSPTLAVGDSSGNSRGGVITGSATGQRLSGGPDPNFDTKFGMFECQIRLRGQSKKRNWRG
jgi:hypothetical protein